MKPPTMREGRFVGGSTGGCLSRGVAALRSGRQSACLIRDGLRVRSGGRGGSVAGRRVRRFRFRLPVASRALADRGLAAVLGRSARLTRVGPLRCGERE